MTAVEWLVQTLIISEDSPNYNKWAIEKAKAIEKEQIKDAWLNSLTKGDWLNSLTKGDYNSAEEYYNKTFKSE